MFLVNVKEALGYTHEETLNSSYALIQTILTEYSYMWNERNKKDSDEEDSHGEFEWVDLPDWDDPSQTNRIKKYKDVGSFIGSEKSH